MQEIGQILKENRLEQNKSIEDISTITKMNTNIITNIEAGNISYFNNDLSYLRYYVRSYISALQIEIEDVEDKLNAATLAFTQSIDILEQEKLDQINDQILNKRVSLEKGKSGFRKARKIDWTLISLISIVTLIGAFLVYSIAVNVINKPNDNTPPVVETPKDKEDDKGKDKEPVEEKPKVPEVIKAEVSAIDANNFEINEWTDDLKIKTKFNTETWVQMSVNNQIVMLPNEDVSSRVYTVGTDLLIEKHYKLNGEEVLFKEGDIISIRYGIMNTNEFFVNDEQLQLEDSVKTSLGGTNLAFTLGKKAVE